MKFFEVTIEYDKGQFTKTVSAQCEIGAVQQAMYLVKLEQKITGVKRKLKSLSVNRS